MILSCPYFHWNDLIANIFKLKRQNINEENIKDITIFQKSEILNKNPSVCCMSFLI